jgi:hypothetical protein
MRSYSDTRVTSRIVDARICISTTNIQVDSKQKTYVLSSVPDLQGSALSWLSLIGGTDVDLDAVNLASIHTFL